MLKELPIVLPKVTNINYYCLEINTDGANLPKEGAMDDFEYDINKRSDKTYMSKSLPAFHDKEAKVRIASKTFDKGAAPVFALVKDELVLRQREGGKRVVKATFYESDRQISVLHLQAYTAETDSPHKAGFALIGEEIGDSSSSPSTFKNTFSSRPPGQHHRRRASKIHRLRAASDSPSC